MTRVLVLLIALAAATPIAAQDRFGRPLSPGERERVRVESLRQTHVENQRLSDDVAAVARARIEALRSTNSSPEQRGRGTARGGVEGASSSAGVPVLPPPPPAAVPLPRATREE